MDQTFCRRHSGYRTDLRTSSGLSHNRYVPGISTEIGDIIMYPSQGGNNI